MSTIAPKPSHPQISPRAPPPFPRNAPLTLPLLKIAFYIASTPCLVSRTMARVWPSCGTPCSPLGGPHTPHTPRPPSLSPPQTAPPSPAEHYAPSFSHPPSAPLPLPQHPSSPLPLPQPPYVPLPFHQPPSALLPLPQPPSVTLPLPQPPSALLPLPQPPSAPPSQPPSAPLPLPQLPSAPLPLPQPPSAPLLPPTLPLLPTPHPIHFPVPHPPSPLPTPLAPRIPTGIPARSGDSVTSSLPPPLSLHHLFVGKRYPSPKLHRERLQGVCGHVMHGIGRVEYGIPSFHLHHLPTN